MDLSAVGIRPPIGYPAAQDIGVTGKVVRDVGVEVDALRNDGKMLAEGVGTGSGGGGVERTHFMQQRQE